MLQNQLRPNKGAKKSPQRVGRGDGSKGKTSGRGQTGQNSRSGGRVGARFEGGQTPLHKRLPKLKGFKNSAKVEYQSVNVKDLDKLKGKVDAKVLYDAGLISSEAAPFKILGDGDIKTALELTVNKISKTAQEKIEKAGGKVELTK